MRADKMHAGASDRGRTVLRIRSLLLLLLALACIAGCRRDADRVAAGAGAREPAQAVLLLTRHLRDNDLAAFARDAVPPTVHQQLETAWRQGRTRWPLDELPFDERLPRLLGALAAPGAEARLQQVFDHQFSGETSTLRAAATALGLFGTQYVQRGSAFSPEERAHYVQFVQALSQWAADAPLGDPGRAQVAIGHLAAAARLTGLGAEADFARLGMQASLGRLSAFLGSVKAVAAGYGLDLDASLRGLKADTLSRQGDRARVRMQYTLAGKQIRAEVAVEQIAGRWYLSDYLRHARAAVALPAPAAAAPVAKAPPSA